MAKLTLEKLERDLFAAADLVRRKMEDLHFEVYIFDKPFSKLRASI